MFDDWTKCDDCSPERIIQEIEMCGFECIAGKLENHIGWIALKKRVADLQALFKSNCKVESIAIAKYAESQKRVAELEKALVRYGNHGGGCAAAYPVGVEAPCSCGYEEALSQDKKEQPDG